jgi:hypothetical protein
VRSPGKQGSALTIWTFNKCRSGKLSSGSKIGLLVKFLGKACSASDDERHVCLLRFKNILTVHGQTLLVGNHGGDVEILFLLAPGKREGVISPQSDRWHVEVCMLAGAESPGTGHANSDAKCVTRQNLHISLCTAASNIARQNANHSNQSLWKR